ncbi:MAG: hypothetical protein JXB19_12135 [Bacteroidales bacterium]|nr:hypothetical protein [Bacteroidales bacterium]
MKASIHLLVAVVALFLIPLIANGQIDSTDLNSGAETVKGSLIHRLFFRDHTKFSQEENDAVLYAGLAVYDNKIIRDIMIRRVDMFAPSVLDTGYIPESWLERTGNALHSDTRNKIIERNILIHAGEKVSALLLTENERIIRSLPYMMDARFLIRSIPDNPDSVDLVLLIKDLWPVAFGGEISDLDAGNVSLWNVNILGLGHQFKTMVFWDAEHAPFLGYHLFYGISNIHGSFFSSRLEYINRWNRNSYLVNVYRDFKTPGLKYAGALNFENTRSQNHIELIDTVISQVNLNYTRGSLWMGRMFTLPGKPGANMRSGIFATGLASFVEFHEGPETTGTYLYDFQDKKQLLFALAYSRQGFQKDNHIYTFDRTEDVPFGCLFEITSGMEWNAYKTRPYIAGSVSAGNYLVNFGYLYGMLQYGTFIHRGVAEQGALNVHLRYFTGLHKGKILDFRGFASFTYQRLMNPSVGEYVSLENRNGISGLTSRAMRGDKKMLLNLESVIFTPIRLLGFRFVFFASADVGLIWRNGTTITGNDFFNGIGIGCRIRNDQLVFDTFELRFTFYPGCSDEASARYFDAGSVPGLRLNDFYPDEPSILKFYPVW